jgi:uncharacterized protein YoxC
MSAHFNLKPDPEVQALKVSPEPQEVLQVIEETVKKETNDVKKVSRAVEDITGEMEVVQGNAKRTKDKLEDVAEDVEEIKQEVKGKTGEHERFMLK